MTLAAAGMAAGCSSHHPASRAVAATTTLPVDAVTVDRWTPPTLGGPPSSTSFCSGLTAMYRHMADLPHAANTAVGRHILADYVSYAPQVAAAAPASIHADAVTYLGAVAGYLEALSRVGLNVAHLPGGALGALTTPAVRSAGTAVLAYSQNQCHYTIGAG